MDSPSQPVPLNPAMLAEMLAMSAGKNEAGPVPQVATRFALTAASVEFVLSCGHTRPVYNGHGQPAGMKVEFHTSLSISPNAAKQLLQMLSGSIEQYEKNFGPIPTEKAVTAQIETQVGQIGGKTVSKTRGKPAAKRTPKTSSLKAAQKK